MRRVAIIGGGISGLAAAHELTRSDADLEVILLEADKRLGGVIRTSRQDGFLLEGGADNFITTPPAALDLCRQLGLEQDLIPTNPIGRQALVVRRGKLRRIPPGFLVMAPSRLWPMLTTPILSPWGKLRAGCEYFVPRRRRGDDESLESFVCRRFGREMFDRLVQPLVGGIYTADPRRLSVAATMPRFLEMEREHGSLIRGMWRQAPARPKDNTSGARYSQFMTLRGGMSTLVDALAEQLPSESIRLDTPVCGVLPNPHGGWSIRVAQGKQAWLDADGLIIAAPANRAAAMLATVDRHLADELSGIEFSSCAVVSLAYRRKQIQHPLNAFGFVAPLIEKRLILSCSFSSVKYEGRAPDGTVLMRVFIGGACQSGLLRLPQAQLIELATSELGDLLRIHGEPILTHVTRQMQAMPQYHVGHCDRIASIEKRLQAFPSLALAGNSLRGVGVPGCIESGLVAAKRIVSNLALSPKSIPRSAEVR